MNKKKLINQLQLIEMGLDHPHTFKGAMHDLHLLIMSLLFNQTVRKHFADDFHEGIS
jgi:hypothetical protein